MSPSESRPAEPKGWAVVGATGTALAFYIVRPLSSPVWNAALVVVAGLLGGLLVHEVEYQMLKRGVFSGKRDDTAGETAQLADDVAELQARVDGLEAQLTARRRSGRLRRSPPYEATTLDATEQDTTSTDADEISGDPAVVKPPDWFVEQANVSDPGIYKQFEETWPDCWERAADLLDWYEPYRAVLNTDDAPFYEWFVGGSLNAAYNCVDRHVENGAGDRTAITWEEEDGSSRHLTYRDLQREVNEFAAALRSVGVQQGDTVTVHLPMIPELPVAMLACARIGAVHSVEFAGTPADDLATRIDKTDTTHAVTCDDCVYDENGPLRRRTDEALRQVERPVSDVIVVNASADDQSFSFDGEYHDYDRLREEWSGTTVPPVERDATDPLFRICIRDEGETMKCIEHTTGGYLSYVAWTSHAVLDIGPEDTCWCATDIPWIPGHSYGIYGPLALGATTVMYGGDIYSPDKHRPWEIVDDNAVDVLYTAPKVVSELMNYGSEYPSQYDLESLRLLATVGQRMEETVWDWYYEHVGQGECALLDTYWQAATGGVVVSPLPGTDGAKPGTVGRPLPGIDARVISTDGTEAATDTVGYLTLHRPWPGMLSTLYDDEDRYRDNYWSNFSDEAGDEWVYLCKSRASVDEDRNIRIHGPSRVVSVSGHQINLFRIETAVADVRGVAQAAVATTDDRETTILAFVVPEDDEADRELLCSLVKRVVADEIGSFARPDRVLTCRQLPKRRSGEVDRDVLGKLAAGEEVDTGPLRNPDVIPHLRTVVADTYERETDDSGEGE